MSVNNGIREIYVRNARFFENNLVTIGWLGFVGYPLYYWIWTEIYPQPYESFYLRMFDALICLPFIFYKLWKGLLSKELFYLYWYFVSITILPFTMSYHMFQNNFSEVWVTCVAMTIYIMVIIMVDWYFSLIACLIGGVAGWIAYSLFPYQPIDWARAEQYVPLLGFAILSAALFNERNKQNIKLQEKMNGIQLGSIQLAQELKKPLESSRLMATSLNEALPDLIEGYWEALRSGEYFPENEQVDHNQIAVMGDLISKDMYYAHCMLEVLLLNSQEIKWAEETFESVSVLKAVTQAIDRYPFREESSDAVLIDSEVDFQTDIPVRFIIYTVFMVIRGSLHLNRQGVASDFSIRLSRVGADNILYIRFDACELTQEQCVQLFVDDAIADGLKGIGLAYARSMIRELGGDLGCDAFTGSGILFSIHFPEYAYKNLSS